MPQLPAGWNWARLGDISEKADTVNPINNPNKEFLYLDITSIDDQQRITNPKRILGKNAPSRARQLVRTGDIIFSTVRTYLRKIAYVSEPYDGQVASTGFCVIRPYFPVNNKFIFFFTQTDDFVNPLTELQRGTHYPAVRNSDVFAQTIPLAPISEQNRIVSKITELFAQTKIAKESIDKIHPILRKFRESILFAAFRGELTERDPNDEPAEKLLERIRNERRNNDDLSARETNHKKFERELEISKLEKLGEGWTWTTIGEVFDIMMGQSPPGTSYNLERKGVPLLNGPTEFGKEFPTARQWTTLPTKVTENGDLLICVRGNTTGKMNWADQRYCIGRGLAAIRSPYPELHIKFLFYFLKIKVPELMDQTTGSTFPNLQREKLNGFLFPLPPTSEQAKITERIESLFSFTDQIEKSVSEAKKRVEKLDGAILTKAFRGELVPQDPDDEPASLLLERIESGRKKKSGP